MTTLVDAPPALHVSIGHLGGRLNGRDDALTWTLTGPREGISPEGWGFQPLSWRVCS